MPNPTDPLARTISTALLGQYTAALATLRSAVTLARDHNLWLETIATRPCWEAAIHATHFTNLDLTPAGEPYPDPPEWVNKDALSFGWSWDPPSTKVSTGDPTDPSRVIDWIDQTIARANEVCNAETEATLAGGSGFDWLPFSKAEAHAYNIRHIQHHAAQLEAMLRRHGLEPKWVKTRAVDAGGA